jgi:asparagine synthase (glutamine-hydrolysing)
MAGAVLRRTRPGLPGMKLAELLRLPAFSIDDTYPVSRLVWNDEELLRLARLRPLPRDRVHAIARGLVRGDGGHRLPLLGQVSICELSTYLQHVLLRDTDQMSMAHALEVRVPFLDHGLVRFVLGLSDRQKLGAGPKPLLVEALDGLLPTEIVRRPKMGFTLPWPHWMKHELKAFCAERISSLGQREPFRREALDRMWGRFLAGDPNVPWGRVWYLVVLEDWLARHGMEN